MLDYNINDIRDKLDKLCIENKLEYSFRTDNFPIIASIRPDLESQNQLTINIGEKSTNYINGEIQFIFADELVMKIRNDFRIEDSLLNKFKGHFKKLHYVYLQKYFKEMQVM